MPDKVSDTLRCLFMNGPTWDGNVPSKSERDDFVRRGLAHRYNGWTQLTPAGLQTCLGYGLGEEKESMRQARSVRHE